MNITLFGMSGVGKSTFGKILAEKLDYEFIDVDENGQIGQLTPINKVDAVVYVNLFGNLAKYDQLKKFCEERKIPLIEDAAQSFGSFYKKIPSGK